MWGSVSNSKAKINQYAELHIYQCTKHVHLFAYLCKWSHNRVP